jgi:hypothetical protein
MPFQRRPDAGNGLDHRAGPGPPGPSGRILRLHRIEAGNRVERDSDSRERQIADYCAGRLPEAQAAAFEAELIADPRLAADVEAVQALRQALQDAAPAEVRKPAVPRLPSWAAIAAGVLVGVIGSFLWWRQDPVAAEGPLPVTQLVLGSTRSIVPVPEERALAIDARSLLVVDVPAPAGGGSPVIEYPDGRQMAVGAQVDEGYLRIALAPPVAPGRYRVTLDGLSYPFVVTRLD